MAPGTRSKESHVSTVSNASSEGRKRTRQTVDDKDKDTPSQAPLGPPPKPSQGTNGDYFSQVHLDSSNNHPYQSEPNPFEAQFGNPSETPGKLLPPVAALTSPSAVLPNETPGWSLRAGPLSPAMLAGPATADYFDTNYSRSFPTPNESGLRTGLTPGGGGSMFPAPSPNSQGIFNALHLGAQTPNTLDFLRTGASAKAATSNLGPTSQPTEVQASQSMDLKLPTTQAPTAESFVHPDADAANGLFMLAQSNGGRNGQFSVPDRAPIPAASSHAPAVMPVQVPVIHKNGNGTSSSPPADNDTSDSDQSEVVAKPATRSRGRRTTETKPANNRRKAADQPVKQPATKKQKAAAAHDKAAEPPSDDEEMAKDGRKMTDEEKRKNFLERNRVAALKCRQRKKQWLQGLQAKADLYGQENDLLTQQVNTLREQVLQLRQILMQHKDCPVTNSQGITPQLFLTYIGSQDNTAMAYPVNGVVPPMGMIVDGRNGPPPIPRTM